MKQDRFRKLAAAVSTWTGTPTATMWAIAIITAWLIVGIPLKFSDTFMLIGNTFMSLVSYLMLFFIQASQNRDARVMSLKMDAIIAALDNASNRLIDLESQADNVVEEAIEEIKSLREDG